MHVLLLGADQRTLSILDTLAELPSDQPPSITGWLDSDAVGDELAKRFPQANRIQTPDDFAKEVHEKSVIVVGQGGDTAEKEKLLRDLARDSIPMILDQPACSGIFAVELDMIQRDTGAPMVPFHPPSHHPVFARLAQWTRASDSPVGPIEQVEMERALPDRSDQAVRAALSRDALLLRRLLGNFQRVGAMPAKEIQSLANLNANLTGETNALGRWSVNPVDGEPGATVALVGQRGRITLNMPDQGEWQLTSTVEELPNETLQPVERPVLAKALADSLDGQAVHPDWEDAFRANDMADIACESVRRGKTLPISNERVTEEDTFKSMMAAGGCLIILVIPLLLLFVSLFDGLDFTRQRTQQLELFEGQRTVRLPGDFKAIETLTLIDKTSNSKTELPALSQRQLYAKHGRNTIGSPAAYYLSRNDISVAPMADQPYELEIIYDGSFRIWGGWPFLLLTPIAAFLALQLLKLAFPKKQNAAN